MNLVWLNALQSSSNACHAFTLGVNLTRSCSSLHEYMPRCGLCVQDGQDYRLSTKHGVFTSLHCWQCTIISYLLILAISASHPVESSCMSVCICSRRSLYPFKPKVV